MTRPTLLRALLLLILFALALAPGNVAHGSPLDSPLPTPYPTAPLPFDPHAEFTVSAGCWGWVITNDHLYEFDGAFYVGTDVDYTPFWGTWPELGNWFFEWHDVMRWFYDGDYVYSTDGGTVTNPCTMWLPVVMR